MAIHDLTALELGKRIAGREISAPEAVRYALERTARIESTLNAFISVSGEEAMKQAESVQKRLDAGEKLSPLAGVPMAVKDNISTRGIRTTCASRMLQDYTPPFDATVIERLSNGGAVLAGKTNLDEFAMGSTSETSFFGPVHNPWSTDRVPGGSSGGSAAAVAAGEVWYALGSDTGGSIRQPSAHCGLTGLKPTYGAVSRYGLIAYASSLDQIGPIARSAADCAAALALIAGPDHRDSTAMPTGLGLDIGSLDLLTEPASLRGLVVGLPDGYFVADLQPEIRRAVRTAADQLAALGARVEPVSLPLVEEAVPAYYLIATAEASANLARFDGIQYGHRPDDDQYADLSEFYCQARQQGFGREVRRRIILGTFALSAGFYDAYYLKALKARQLVKQGFETALSGCDMLLAPVAPTTAPRLGASLDDPLAMYLADIFTVSANLAGLPALAMPCGLDDHNMPIGFQLIGPAFSDRKLLSVGVAYQAATAFHRSRPRIGEGIL